MISTEPLRITIFYCSNSFSSEEISYCSAKLENVEVNSISLPCSGKVNLLYLLKSIETGSDGAILLTCRLGECKFIQGNYRAQKRVEAVDELIVEAGLSRGHVRCLHLLEKNIECIANEINEFSKQLRADLIQSKKIA